MRIRDAAETQWLRDYLDRRLTGAQAVLFEAHALTHTDLLTEIEVDTALRDATILTSETQRSHRAARRRSRVASRPPPMTRRIWLSSAASVVLGLGTGFLYARSYIALDEPLVAPGPTRVSFDRTRGAGQAMRVEHVDMQSPFILVEVALPPGARNPIAKVGRFPAQGLMLSLDGYAGFLVRRTFLDENGSASVAYDVDGESVVLPLDLSSLRHASK